VVGGHVRAIIALPHSTKEPAYLFQAVSGRSIIRPGGALFMTKDTFHERADPGLIIGSRVNAVWQSGELLFRKESDARRVLDFSAIFEPATNKQLEAFAGHQKLTCDKNWLKNEASDFYRRRIAAILAGGVLEKFSVTQLQDAAAKVKFTLPLDTDQNGQRRIKIGDNKKELKRVLQFLNEDIYRAPITEEIFCAAGKTEFDA